MILSPLFTTLVNLIKRQNQFDWFGTIQFTIYKEYGTPHTIQTINLLRLFAL
jgi:hypothetical protein